MHIHRPRYVWPEDAESYAAQILLETREEVGRADTKVEILFATFGLVAAVLAGVATGDWSPRELARVATVVFS